MTADVLYQTMRSITAGDATASIAPNALPAAGCAIQRSVLAAAVNARAAMNLFAWIVQAPAGNAGRGFVRIV